MAFDNLVEKTKEIEEMLVEPPRLVVDESENRGSNQSDASRSLSKRGRYFLWSGRSVRRNSRSS